MGRERSNNILVVLVVLLVSLFVVLVGLSDRLLFSESPAKPPTLQVRITEAGRNERDFPLVFKPLLGQTLFLASSITSEGVSTGSGLAAGRWLLTARHLLGETAEPVYFLHYDADNLIVEWEPAYLRRGWPDRDLALFSLANPRLSFPEVTISSSLPRLGETVVMIGYHEALRPQLITSGVVLTIDEKTGYFTADAPGFFGLSGAPVFNIKGELLGITEHIGRDRPFIGVNSAIPIKEYLEANSEEATAYGQTSWALARV